MADTLPTTPQPDTMNAMVRRTRMRAHSYRSVGVGLFSAWAVTLDRVLSDAAMSIPRFLGVTVCAAAMWFLIGGGSGILWSYLPQSLTRRDRDRAT